MRSSLVGALALAVCALLPAGAHAVACPVEADLDHGVRITYDDGTHDTFAPSHRPNHLFLAYDVGDRVTHEVQLHGTYFAEAISPLGEGRGAFFRRRALDQMPEGGIPAPDTYWGGQIEQFDHRVLDGLPYPSIIHLSAKWGPEHDLDIGDCTYRAISGWLAVTNRFGFVERLKVSYLPALGLSVFRSYDNSDQVVENAEPVKIEVRTPSKR